MVGFPRTPSSRKWVALASSLVLLACSTTSTIYRKKGPPIEAEVVGGSKESIFVDDGNQWHEIPRSDIRDIDYPGDVHAGVGAGILAYGALNIAVGFDQCAHANENQAAFCTGVFLPRGTIARRGAALIDRGAATKRCASPVKSFPVTE